MTPTIIELGPGTTERLDRIIALLEGLNSPKCQNCADDIYFLLNERLRELGLLTTEDTPTTVDNPEEEKPVEAQETAKAEVFPIPEWAPEPPEPPAVGRSDIQHKVVTLSAAGKKAQVREIVTEYAPRVSAIPEDKLVEVWQRLTELEG